MKIKVKMVEPRIQEFKFIGKKSNWIDLRSAENLEFKKGEFKLVPLGFSMQLPEGYEANILPRSSTFKNFGLIQTNGMGVIDSSYCGDEDYWFFPALAMRDTAVKKGDRICQFRIIESMQGAEFIEVEFLGNQNRGGHGSTGIK